MRLEAPVTFDLATTERLGGKDSPRQTAPHATRSRTKSLVIVFGAAFDVEPVVDWLEDFFYLRDQRFVEWLLGPVDPLGDAIGIC